MTELLAIGTGVAISGPITVPEGGLLTLSLKLPENLTIPGGVLIYIDLQMSNNHWLMVDRLTTSEPALATNAMGTYRTRRDVRSAEAGVDYEL